MRRVFWWIISIDIILIMLIKYIEYNYDHKGGDEWIEIGEQTMAYLLVPNLFFIVSLFATLFIKDKIYKKIIVIVLSIIGLLVYKNVWLYPW
jgi:hypothetical protein